MQESLQDDRIMLDLQGYNGAIFCMKNTIFKSNNEFKKIKWQQLLHTSFMDIY